MRCGSGDPERVPFEKPIEGREGDALCDALSSSQIHAAGCSAPADGFSLVHRAAGSSFVEHVLSKGNSIDLWQGFLSFVGE